MFGVRLSKMGSASKLGLIAKAIGILRSYGADAHVYLPGIGTVSGLTAGNYLDSAGVTAATVDNPIGLSLDALQAMTLGSELATNGDNEAALFNLGAMGSQNITSSRVAAVGGRSGFVMRGLSSSAASVKHQYNCVDAILSANTAYLISVDVYVPTGGISSCKFFDNNDGSFFSPDVTTKDAWVTLTAIRQPKATSWALGFGNNLDDVVASGSPAFYLDNVSVREIPGIHATQATTANKPILRRGLFNLLTQSNDPSNATSWPKVNTTAPASVALAPDGTTCYALTDDATNADHKMRQVVTVSVGTVVTFVVVVKAGTAGYVWLYDGYANSGKHFNLATQSSLTSIGTAPTAFSTADLGDGWAMYTITYTASTSTMPELGMSINGSTFNYIGSGSTVLVDAAGLFQGTYTAQQILDAGGIPLTTSAAASSTTGKYWWQFDGSNDSLSLSAPLFQMSDDHCVIAGVNQTIAANGYVFSQNNTAATTLVGAIAVTSGGFARALWEDDIGTTAFITGSVPITGVTKVVTAIKRTNAKQLRVNGSQDGATNNTVMGATTLNTASIGSYTTAGNLTGSIYPIFAIKGTLSDSDLLVLERFVGQLSGVSI